jgi:hypothetical protein
VPDLLTAANDDLNLVRRSKRKEKKILECGNTRERPRRTALLRRRRRVFTQMMMMMTADSSKLVNLLLF